MFSEFLSQNLLWVTAFMVVANLWLWSLLQNKVKGVGDVSVLEMPSLQRGSKNIIVDVSDSSNFSAGHIPDSINIPLADINEEHKQLLKQKNKRVILVSETGAKSSKAARLLLAMGFEDLHILSGGMMSWNKENLPTSKSA